MLQTALQHHQAGRLPEAEVIYRQVLGQSPGHPGALHLLGVLTGQVGRVDLAIEMVGQAAQSAPDSPQIQSDLGVFLMDSGRLDEAIIAYRRAIQLDPDFASAHANLGAALTLKCDYAEAVASCRRAIELSPKYIQAHLNLASALRGLARYDQAIQVLRQALSHQPDHVECHHNLGWLLMLTGDFKSGWPELEWRNALKSKHWSRQQRVFSQPRWDGSNLVGRTILLHAEQGFGDTLQFVRYVPLIARQAGQVILECQPELFRLLNHYPGATKVIRPGETLPPFDLHCPLGSLPFIFQTQLTSIPPAEPIIRPETTLLHTWENRLGPKQSRLRVGLTWNSNPTLQAQQHRSISLHQLAPVANLKEIELFSLQKGPGFEQIQELPTLPLKDYTADLTDFADTAALIAQLDLILTVDTSVAHLAATMGKPTWLMLSFSADWRWLLDRNDSPWYPTMRLCRQPSPGDWPSVVDQIIAALSRQI
jgi:Flp pilus assembly protein TadD